MRTNIEINDILMQQAFEYTDATTKRELVDIALREFVAQHQKKDLRELLGKVTIDPTYDYKASRT